jgi:hypothetical protein
MSGTPRAALFATPQDADGGVLYEARYAAATADAAAFDTWLRDRIADVLQSPGFLSAEILDEAAPAADTVTRTVHYRVRDAAACTAFLDGPTAALELEGPFGDHSTIARRVFGSRESFQHGAVSTENCLNCGEVLRGQHCMHCGQRARVRVLSLWGLLRDVLGDLLDWDARIWRTLRPLAFRPGLLTQEFLRGRRTWYTPPFRMYLVLSVAFFVVASFGDGVAFELDDKGAQLRIDADVGVGTRDAPAQKDAEPPAPPLDPEREALVTQIIDTLPFDDKAEARAEVSREIAQIDEKDLAPLKSAAADPCGPETLKIGLGRLQDWEPRLRESCRRIVADQQGFKQALADNIPRMLFVFLPLIALLMQLLYAGSGRFYVEHLLFFVHFHAYFFLGGLVIALLVLSQDALADTAAAGPLASATNAFTAAFSLWSPIYLYLAMRRVYGQGRLLTLFKYTLLGLGYLVGLLVTMLVLLVWTALSL